MYEHWDSVTHGEVIGNIYENPELLGKRMKDWNELKKHTKTVESWSKTKSPEIQKIVQRIISAAHGETANEVVHILSDEVVVFLSGEMPK